MGLHADIMVDVLSVHTNVEWNRTRRETHPMDLRLGHDCILHTIEASVPPSVFYVFIIQDAAVSVYISLCYSFTSLCLLLTLFPYIGKNYNKPSNSLNLIQGTSVD